MRIQILQIIYFYLKHNNKRKLKYWLWHICYWKRDKFPDVSQKIIGEIVKQWYPYLRFIDILRKWRNSTPVYKRLNKEIIKIEKKNYKIEDQILKIEF